MSKKKINIQVDNLVEWPEHGEDITILSCKFCYVGQDFWKGKELKGLIKKIEEK